MIKFIVVETRNTKNEVNPIETNIEVFDDNMKFWNYLDKLCLEHKLTLDYTMNLNTIFKIINQYVIGDIEYKLFSEVK